MISKVIKSPEILVILIALAGCHPKSVPAGSRPIYTSSTGYDLNGDKQEIECCIENCPIVYASVTPENFDLQSLSYREKFKAWSYECIQQGFEYTTCGSLCTQPVQYTDPNLVDVDGTNDEGQSIIATCCTDACEYLNSKTEALGSICEDRRYEIYQCLVEKPESEESSYPTYCVDRIQYPKTVPDVE